MGAIIPSKPRTGLIGDFFQKKVSTPIANYVGSTKVGKVAGKVGLALGDQAAAGYNTLGYVANKVGSTLLPDGSNAQARANEAAGNYAQGTSDAIMGVRANSPHSYEAPAETTLDKAHMLPGAKNITIAPNIPNKGRSPGQFTQSDIDTQRSQNLAANFANRGQNAAANQKNDLAIGGGGDWRSHVAGGTASDQKKLAGAPAQDTGKKDASGKGLTFVVDGKTMYSPSGNRMDAVPASGQTQASQTPPPAERVASKGVRTEGKTFSDKLSQYGGEKPSAYLQAYSNDLKNGGVRARAKILEDIGLLPAGFSSKQMRLPENAQIQDALRRLDNDPEAAQKFYDLAGLGSDSKRNEFKGQVVQPGSGTTAESRRKDNVAAGLPAGGVEVPVGSTQAAAEAPYLRTQAQNQQSQGSTLASQTGQNPLQAAGVNLAQGGSSGLLNSSAPPDNSYGGLIGELANRGRRDSEQIIGTRQALEDSRMREALALKQVALPENRYGRSLSYQQGAGNVLQNLYGNEQNALASTLSSEMQSQGQQIGALGSAAGLMSPMQFGLTMDPITGQPINMSAMQVPMQTAMQLYQAGTPLSDPAYSQALGPIGSAGWMMFYNALQNGGAGGMGGGLNPAAQSAAQNQQLGFNTSLLAQNQQLGQGIAQLNALQPHVTQFMQAAGINPTDYPKMNEQIGIYLDRLGNPGASQQWEAIKLQLGAIVPQILAAKQSAGMQPNAKELLAVSDPSALSMTDLNALMNTWKALGGTTLGVNQNLYQQSGGYGGVYQGGNANQGSFTASQSGSGAGGITNTGGQAAAGTLWQILSAPGAIANFITGLFA